MSSEMRELEPAEGAYWDTHMDCPMMGRDLPAPRYVPLYRLARTEAGADGADLRETLDDRLDWLRKVSGPAKAFQASNVVVRLSTAEESIRMLFAAPLRTHPQDGDAAYIAKLQAALSETMTRLDALRAALPKSHMEIEAAALQQKESGNG